ncbi:MAG: hypothetical protein C4539_13605 [Ignavibacteriales bacterium]|nr:MAG: hypothetical protein C4539_13605 [Ignavibacteriales bacterium]
MKNHFKIFLLLYLIIQSVAFAQIKIHKKLGVEDGLVQSTVRVIYKDVTGRLWFGTKLGVSCWDGINFTNYSTTSGLPGHIVYSIKNDKDGNIIFGTSNGAAIFKDGKINTLPVAGNAGHLKINNIETSKDGNVFFGTNKGLYTIKNNKLIPFTGLKHYSALDITCGTQLENGDIIWGTAENGIIKMPAGNYAGSYTLIDLHKNNVNFIFRDKDGNLLCNVSNKLFLISETGKILQQLKIPKDFENITSVEQDSEGCYYFGTEKGILVWKDNRQLEIISEKNGLSSNQILSIFKDIDDTFYFGMNNGGVAVINRYKMITLNKEHGLVDNNITSIVETGDHSFYFGTRERGISHFVDGSFKRAFENYDQIICSFKDKTGKIYFGTNNGVLVINGGKESSITVKDGLPTNIITAITGDANGKIYIGTVRGLSVYNNGKIRNLTKKNLLGDNLVTSLSAFEGKVYVGTFFNGITIIEQGKSRIINNTNGLISNTVLSVYKSPNGKLYIGTVEGLNIELDGKIKTINSNHGLSDNSINSIAEDKEGKIYLATNHGINILDESNGQTDIHTLHAEDGIAGEESNMGAVYKDSKENLWFGTIKGVVSFDPAKIKPSVYPPRVMLSDFHLFNKDVPWKEQPGNYEFTYDQNFFKFNFFGVMLSAPKRVTYAYRLKGIDNEWLFTQQNSVQYTNLNDGTYTFEVKAKNEWGYWGKPAIISFVITPPFWELWWFILLVALVIVGGIYLVVYKQLQNVLTLERIRLKIAADLHDNIGASLTEISIMSEILKSKINTDSDEVRKYLSSISNESRNVIASIRDIVWMVNPNQDTLKDLLTRLNDSFSDIFTQKGISFTTENIELLSEITLPMDYRHNLFLILKEGINNSLKYSYCDQLSLKAAVNGKRLEVILKDNGIGIKPNYKKNGNGLTNMKNRAEKIGGDLFINSDIYNGTELKFMGKIS